ncbi:MAG: SMC-Scp complex subunit ScpB [Mycoplasmatales bacterium]
MKHKKAAVEGLLYLSGEKGVSIGELIVLLNVDEIELDQIMKEIIADFQTDEHGIEIVLTANSYKFKTKKEHFGVFQGFASLQYNDRIANSAVETLAIIAYNQPMTRFQIEEIKGVSPSHSLQSLLERELVEVVGKSEEIGHPNLYGVTSKFYELLGINEMTDLPPLQEFAVEEEESAQVDLFVEYDDFKEIRKRLLSEVEFTPKTIEIEDDVEVPELILHTDEELEEIRQKQLQNEQLTKQNDERGGADD